MNIPAQDETSRWIHIGQSLRHGRERSGLSQKDVAESLCLKLTIVKEIENGHLPTDLPPLYFHGYIRLYARLVQVPEDQIPACKKTVQHAFTQTLRSEKRLFQSPKTTTKITCFIFFVLMLITAAKIMTKDTPAKTTLSIENTQQRFS